jgi:GGDEF domain-containing protein
VVEALGAAIEQITISSARGHAVRSSIGLAFIDERSAGIDVVMAEADRAMYAAKRAAKVGAATRTPVSVAENGVGLGA